MNRQQVEATTEMSAAKFRKIAVESNMTSVIQIQVINIADGGWAILGPFGIYKDVDGTKVFDDLARVHQVLSEWGVRKFLQDGQEKMFRQNR
jgi:hypothetical protein